ncbi:DUF4932 domain-containing protein [Marivirga sp. S37H4]|uniref:DUF4932 domain-containing protein n=1 Tax=Marivirga aurantiaca TaxID=2802615 RepID=A0A934WZ33_9BACT|nr:DUF4932 domain-containing protein [Marivirga aurantiaca]MBK6265654.1 DUF4932 domain-containing protein [Marivirga aurantiaca]
MRQTNTLLFFCLIFIGLLNKAQASNQEKLNISFHKNVELLGFGYFLAFEGKDIENKTVEVDGEVIPKMEWHNYGYHFYKKYNRYSSSSTFTEALAVADHLWLDYLINFLLQVEDFPSAKLTDKVIESSFIRFSTSNNIEEAKEKATIFLEGLNKFYEEVNFEEYLNTSAPYYSAAIKEIENNLPNANFIEDLEQFYGSSFNKYSLIPSLTIPKSMAFGLIHNEDHIYNVFGAFGKQIFLNTESLTMGFNDSQKIRELSIHEFGHSFVNPTVYKVLSNERISAISSLFEPIREAMNEQGYNTWKASIYEHFVRAGEIVIAEEAGYLKEARRLYSDYVDKRKFIYIPIIIGELRKYRKEKSYTYEEAVLRAFGEIEKNSTKSIPATENSPFPTDPKEAQFHLEDVNRFWEVFDKQNPKFKGKIFQEEYINKGSIGLLNFINNRIGNGRLLAKTVKKNLAYYLAIRESSVSLNEQKEEFYEIYENLQRIYPEAVFPDVYFVIGRRNSGGTIFKEGLIIGAERFGKPSDNFQPDIDIDLLDNTIAHELVHFQQNYVRDNSLLAQSIREGAGDFIGELISGDHPYKAIHEYGNAHESELWNEFLVRKDSNDWSNWLYYSKDKSRPKDLGYWMGYKICKAYYDQSEDKMQAIHDILNIKNFNDFLSKSGYNGE